ncbi:glutamate receptor-like [Penaeus vannamei]|uniref:glutamate receptor-like n=1 Tax=Penaeus vannamei TaxID=6689 RepID=UPI00387F51F2
MWPYLTYDKAPDGTLTSLGGFHHGIWEDMREALNFSYTCHEASENNWGSLMEELARGESDITFAPVTMLRQRLDIIDFSLGITENYFVMATRRQEGIPFSWTKVVRGVSVGACLATLGALVGVAFVVALISLVAPSETEGVGVAEALTLTLGAMAGQGWYRSMRSPSGRIVLFTVFAFTLLVYCHYTALLTSTLAVTSILPFSNLEELLRANTHRFLFRGTAVSSMFENSTDKTISRIWSELILPYEDARVTDYSEGFERVASDESLVLILPFITYLEKVGSNCTFTYLPQKFLQVWESFAFRKNLYLKEVFNRQLTKMLNTGVIQRRQQEGTAFPHECELGHVASISMRDTAAQFLMLVAVSAGAALVLISLDEYPKLDCLAHRSMCSPSGRIVLFTVFAFTVFGCRGAGGIIWFGLHPDMFYKLYNN